MTIAELLDIGAKAGFSGGLLIILWGSYKNWWVWGSTLRAAVERYEKGLTERDAIIKTRDTTIDDLRSEAKEVIAERARTAEREREALERLVMQAQREREAQNRQLDMLLSLVPRGESSSPGPSFPSPSIRELDQ